MASNTACFGRYDLDPVHVFRRLLSESGDLPRPRDRATAHRHKRCAPASEYSVQPQLPALSILQLDIAAWSSSDYLRPAPPNSPVTPSPSATFWLQNRTGADGSAVVVAQTRAPPAPDRAAISPVSVCCGPPPN